MTFIRYGKYTVEISDALIEPFKALSTVLVSGELENDRDLLFEEPGHELIQSCDCHVAAAIGKHFAHDFKLREALAAWSDLGFYSRLDAILEAAHNTEPVDFTRRLEKIPNKA